MDDAVQIDAATQLIFRCCLRCGHRAMPRAFRGLAAGSSRPGSGMTVVTGC